MNFNYKVKKKILSIVKFTSLHDGKEKKNKKNVISQY